MSDILSLPRVVVSVVTDCVPNLERCDGANDSEQTQFMPESSELNRLTLLPFVNGPFVHDWATLDKMLRTSRVINRFAHACNGPDSCSVICCAFLHRLGERSLSR